MKTLKSLESRINALDTGMLNIRTKIPASKP